MSNPNQADSDLDGIGDQCDPDDDNDGFSDSDELDNGTDPFLPGRKISIMTSYRISSMRSLLIGVSVVH